VVIGSLSKTYGLPGLRLGWVAASKERIARLRTAQQYLSLSLNAITVALGSAILDRAERFSRASLIRKNRRILINWAKKHGNISISAPVGGTTVCLSINTAVEGDELFDQFVRHGVLLAPGTRCFEFGDDIRWFRLGYGAESDALRRGLKLVSAVVGALGS
jgi:DNA-binding transcriptional MocR family regulator